MEYFLVVLFGAVMGSFLNVLILRHGARSISGRSGCLSCGAAIRWYDNVPIISWLLLRGRCRSCGSRISFQYPLVEAVAAALFLVIIPRAYPLWYGAEILPALLLMALIGGMVAIAVYDAKHTIIPDAWVYFVGAVAVTYALVTHFAPAYLVLLSGPATALPLFVLWLVSRGTWMGLGDAKLALAMGWVLGPLYGPLSILLAFVIGAVISVLVLMPLPYALRFLREKGIVRLSASAAHFTMKSEVAFGPFLVAAFFITWLSLLYQVPLPV